MTAGEGDASGFGEEEPPASSPTYGSDQGACTMVTRHPGRRAANAAANRGVNRLTVAALKPTRSTAASPAPASRTA